MADPRFFQNQGPFTLTELAQCCGAKLSDESLAAKEIHDVAPLDRATANQISFLDNRKYVKQFTETKAGACIVHPDLAEQAPAHTSCLLSPLPYKAYALVAQAFYPVLTAPSASAIHKSAIIAETATLGENCIVEAGVVIDDQARIGAGCHIKANAVIQAGVELGDGCQVGANATLSHCLLGKGVVIYPGAQIGQRGFGFAIDPAAGFFTVPQLGRVIIGDYVEVGAGCTIDRGAGPDTVIGRGTRIDNLVQIGHNVQVGEFCVLVAQCGVAGSTKLENYVMVGGQSAVAGHLTIGTGAKIAGKSGVMRDVKPGQEMMGYPAMPIKEFFRQVASLKKLSKKGKKKK
ncbi:MAG: UDP-3-O-(3-hydroxymyristoyl)glucosamine N-acyltransferase [Thermodesulfobacteriota bacterium]